jgi:hypothetical protein
MHVESCEIEHCDVVFAGISPIQNIFLVGTDYTKSRIMYNGYQKETRLETWFGETGLKIRPDVFCHDNCEQI